MWTGTVAMWGWPLSAPKFLFGLPFPCLPCRVPKWTHDPAQIDPHCQPGSPTNLPAPGGGQVHPECARPGRGAETNGRYNSTLSHVLSLDHPAPAAVRVRLHPWFGRVGQALKIHPVVRHNILAIHRLTPPSCGSAPSSPASRSRFRRLRGAIKTLSVESAIPRFGERPQFP